jgi:hypothetical protein
MPIAQGIDSHARDQGNGMLPVGTDTLEVPAFEIAPLASCPFEKCRILHVAHLKSK